MRPLRFALLILFALVSTLAICQNSIRETYTKYEYMIPMRDGVRLYTSVYVPKNVAGKHPILLERTPYSAGPYGPNISKNSFRGSKKMQENGYIFAFQDVRGRFMSEGQFVDVRPQMIEYLKPNDIDESTDTYDTIDWMIKNVPDNNGRLGIWGISYPGGYAAMGCINNHPALKAASPQAPVSDWFRADDFHHNGAFFVQYSFSFYSGFGWPRPVPTANPPRGGGFSLNGDAYKFFLDLGPLSTVNDQYFHGQVKFWNDLMAHGTMDEFWQARSLEHNMKGVTAAVLTTGGFFDAEDCWGALHIYDSIEKQNKGITNGICMGPWFHGGWAGGTGQKFGDLDFESKVSEYYRENIEFPFFDAYLRGDGKFNLPEAQVFETGTNKWRTFSSWPPKSAKPISMYLGSSKSLVADAPLGSQGSDMYVSDPTNPVPYQGGKLVGRSREYMIADQRFAEARPDVLTYRSAVLDKDFTAAGAVWADLFFTCTGSDCDFVVKVIDEHPTTTTEDKMSGYEQLIRSEIFRAKFRNSYSNPSPLVPGKVETLSYELPAIMHTFRKGHRIMIQIQSSWFPLVDRNPQLFTDIYSAKASDYQKATISILRAGNFASRVRFSKLN